MNERSVHRAAIDSDELNLLEYALTIWRRRWQVAVLCVVTVLTTAFASSVIPRAFEATTALLGPKEEGASSLLGSLGAAAMLPIPGVSVPSGGTNRDLIIGILKSRTVALAAVEKFDLRRRYDMTLVEEAVLELQRNRTVINLSKEGVISLTIEDTDPKVAAAMADFFVEKTDELVASLGVSDAGRQRVFVTAQLARARGELKTAEEALRRFQERHQAIVLPEQTRGAIDAAARLKGELMASEVQLQVVLNFVTEASPEAVSLKKRIEELRKQLVRIEYGTGAVPAAQRDFHVPFADVPGVGLELARLTREVKTYEALTLILTQQVEQARFAEAKDLPIVRVLDRAPVPERQSRPKPIINMALALVTSLFVGAFVMVFLEYVRNLTLSVAPR